VRKLKGETRPINDEYHRGKKLFDLECVDFITVFNEVSPINYLRELKPDIYVKAGDYNLDTINQEERRLVESYGGQIVIIPVVHDVSTTKIIEGMRGG